MRSRAQLFFFAVFILIAVLFYGTSYFSQKKQVSHTNVGGQLPTHNPCIDDNEKVSYVIHKAESSTSTATILIKDRSSSRKIYSFDIELALPYNYHPIELHKCGVYATRDSNYDHKRGIPLPGFKIELWQYSYKGQGKSLILLGSVSGIGFGTDFRVDSSERYIALKRGYLGSADYAVVIKDLNTLRDIFTLPATTIEKQRHNMFGDISFEGGGWSQNGRYFWANTYEAANTLGFIQIDSKDWSYKLLPAPQDVLGGDALNLESGYITVHPGNVWFGIAEMTNQEKAARRAKGIGTELYIHNLFTGKRIFVASTTEPLYYFVPQWIASSVLQYKLPSGATTTYSIPR